MALTKDRKRLRRQEVAVHLAWRSTLYVTNFPEKVDDAFMRELFGQVRDLTLIISIQEPTYSSVWHNIRRPLAE
jgi:hypothetical protein